MLRNVSKDVSRWVLNQLAGPGSSLVWGKVEGQARTSPGMMIARLAASGFSCEEAKPRWCVRG